MINDLLFSDTIKVTCIEIVSRSHHEATMHRYLNKVLTLLNFAFCEQTVLTKVLVFSGLYHGLSIVPPSCPQMSEPSIWCAAFLLAPYLTDDKHGSQSETGRDDEPCRNPVPAASETLVLSVAMSGRGTSYTNLAYF